MVDLLPLGDRAFLITFADEGAAARGAERLGRSRFILNQGVVDIVLAYRGVAVHADPEVCDLGELERSLTELLTSSAELSAGAERVSSGPGPLVEIPVLYDGEDLVEVASRLQLGPDQVVDFHSGVDYQVFALGFMPGFPYSGYLPEQLAGLPRRDAPRKCVPAGSVAIAGRQTGIYPQASPGGWHLIGRTPLVMAEVSCGHFPIRAGDRLRFRPIRSDEYHARLGEWLVVSGREPLA